MAVFRHRWLRVSLLLLLLFLLAIALLWVARIPLVRPFITDYLADHDIAARYRIEKLTPDEVVLADVSLGPAERPDFTATHIRVTRAGHLWQPAIGRVEVRGATLHAAVGADGLHFGALDALIPASSGKPLPAIDMQLDGQVLLDTPAGPVRAHGAGAGVLRNGFQANMQVAPADFRLNDCHVRLGDGSLRFTTDADAVRVAAEALASEAMCTGVAAREIRLAVAANGDPTLRRWQGDARAAAEDARRGDAVVARPRMVANFAGDMQQWRGNWSADADGAKWPAGTAGAVRVAGDFAAGKTVEFSGEVRAEAVDLRAVDTRAMPEIVSVWVGNAGRALRNFAIVAPFSGRFDGDGLALHVPSLSADAVSGARLAFGGPEGVRLDGGQMRVDGDLRLAGGGLPDARVDLTLADGRLGLSGEARYSGAMGGGAMVHGMALQFAASGTDAGIALGCATVRLQGARQGDFQLGATQIAACPDGDLVFHDGQLAGALRVEPVRLTGRAGKAFALAVDGARLRAGGGVYALSPATLRLNFADMEMAATLGGEMRGGRLAGTLADVAVDGADLPATIDSGGGAWSFADGEVRLRDGEVRLADRPAEGARARFQPLMLSGIAVYFADGTIRAEGRGGLASQPAAARVPLFSFSAAHRLDDGKGSARVATGDLLFGPELQPWQITEMLRGVIENVRGTVDAALDMHWEGENIAGTGHVALTDVSLATAALGPVDGINGRIEISDVMEIRSPPGQEITVAAINPGILAENGRFRLQLMGGGALQLEAQWPFYGGTLTLRPLLFEPDATERSFTLDAEGVDAGLFLQGFNLKDINATGTFDGSLPLEFGAKGGRITQGVLTARAPGGLVQYAGDVGADEMGAAGKLAFDALRGLRYSAMVLKLDGELDGELLTEIFLDGVNENPVGNGMLTAAGMPFRFNISVRAPFRSLLGTAASFGDARSLIRSGSVGATPKEDAQFVQPR